VSAATGAILAKIGLLTMLTVDFITSSKKFGIAAFMAARASINALLLKEISVSSRDEWAYRGGAVVCSTVISV
jgi:ABC-type transport system involved in cytochrome c biogenesis permease subunit